jgi:hypothetical protein
VSEPAKCLRCQGDLKVGFIPDASYNAIFSHALRRRHTGNKDWLVDDAAWCRLVGKVLNFSTLRI